MSSLNLPVVSYHLGMVSKNFNHLPRHVILLVFGFLDMREIGLFVWPVCKTWLDIGRDPILWKCVSIRVPYKIKTVTSIILAPLEWVGKSCWLLDTLMLRNCSVASASAVQSVVLGCPHLKHLSLFSICNSAFNEFADLKTLVKLELCYFRNLSDDFLPRLSRNSRQLQEVVLHACSYLSDEKCFTDANMVPFFTNLKGLKSIDLSAFHCGKDTFRAISKCTDLSSISFDEPIALCVETMQALEKFQNISDLSFRLVFGVNSAAWLSFVTNVPSSHLNSLSFEMCANLDPILENILLTCKDSIFYKAKSINFSSSEMITDNAVSMILKGNSELHTLNLFDCDAIKGDAFNFSDTSIAPVLRRLELRHCYGVPVEYLKTFLNNRQGLTIINANGEEMKL